MLDIIVYWCSLMSNWDMRCSSATQWLCLVSRASKESSESFELTTQHEVVTCSPTHLRAVHSKFHIRAHRRGAVRDAGAYQEC